MRCKLLPPRGLYHPVLPYEQKSKCAHKLLFGLCRTCMNKIDQDCSHQTFYEYETREEKTYKKKHCRDCLNYRNEECKHSNEERCLIGSWATIEIKKALEKGYKILEIYEVDHFSNTSKVLFKEYVNKFYKIKAESTGCPCSSKCSLDCPKNLNI
jgi:hypothetical protein